MQVGDGALGTQIGERFDLVSMDWRGVGASDPALECDVERDALLAMTARYDVLDPTDLERALSIAEEWMRGCVADYDEDFLASLGSRNAARDLDRLRAALGDEQLSFWGFSYGTSVGATYATMFPERVRAFVLDSVSLTAPTPSLTREEIASLEARLDEFFDWCAGNPGPAPACEFAQGRDASELDLAWRALVAELDRYPAVVDGESVSGNTVRGAALAMRLDGRVAFESMGVAFAQAERGDYVDTFSVAAASAPIVVRARLVPTQPLDAPCDPTGMLDVCASGALCAGDGASTRCTATAATGCAAPIELTPLLEEPRGNLVYFGTTTGGPNALASSCQTGAAPEIVHRFVMPYRGRVRLDVRGRLVSVVSVRTTCTDAVSEQLCERRGVVLPERLGIVEADTELFVVVEAWGDEEAGTYELELNLDRIVDEDAPSPRR